MAIVKRKNKAGNIYYFNDVTKKFSSEAAYNRSKGAAKSAKTQFKTAKGYACSKAGKDLVTKRTSSAGKRLRSC